MTMTMQQTQEIILAMLSTANGLETNSYLPHPCTPDEYLAPGNYAKAESVVRDAGGVKFNWVAYSSYGEDHQMNCQELKSRLEQMFTSNELCQNVHATIYHNEEGMAHRVEFRFYTFGVELSDNPDSVDFCPSCGWNTEDVKCNAGPDDHPSEDCHYLCSQCGRNTGSTIPCLRKIIVNTEIKSRMFLNRSPDVVSAVNPEVSNAVGEILIGYALAENSLRAMMENLPGHNPHSNLSADIERLQRHQGAIVASALEKSDDGGQAMEECIESIISTYDRVRNKRNTLAHGQLVQVGLMTLTIGRDNANQRKDQGSRLQIEHDGETVELTEYGIQELLDNTRELQAQVGCLGQISQFLASR